MKKLLSLALALGLTLGLAAPALAADAAEETEAAWSLYQMGLFQGTGTDAQGFPLFDLDKAPTRAQGVTMLVRLLGQEAAARAETWDLPFRDVPDWARPYVGYAYANGLTTGRGETVFDPNTPVSATEYLTFVLRALGYQSGTDFAWDAAWVLSDKLGLTDGRYQQATDRAFDRGDAALVSARALDAKPKGGEETLRARLGVRDESLRCLWREESLLCMPNRLVFAFRKEGDSPEGYQKFVVEAAAVNGVPCQVEQETTPAAVAQRCQALRQEKDVPISLPDAFALVSLTYDEGAALAAATETVEDGGQTYPVLRVRLRCTGTLADGTQVREFLSVPYYIHSYGGKYGDIF